MIYNNPIPTATYKVLFSPYTGNGFNATKGTSASYETGTIAPTDMLNSNYVIINVTVACSASASSGNYASVSLKIETKYPAGAYSTDFDQTILSNDSSSFSSGNGTAQTITIVHLLTANEKLNGLVIKFTGTGTGSVSGAGCSISNVQTSAFSLS